MFRREAGEPWGGPRVQHDDSVVSDPQPLDGLQREARVPFFRDHRPKRTPGIGR